MINLRLLAQAIVAVMVIACPVIVMAAPGEESQSSALLECAAVTDDAERLQCFDDKLSDVQPATAVESAAEIPVAESVVVVKAAENQVAESTAVATTAGDQVADSTNAAQTAENPPATQSATAEAAETATDAPAGSSSSPATSDVDEFGMTATLSTQLPSDERAVELTEISATVTEVSKRPYGEHVVTLDNGQVWTEKDAEYGFRVKVGDTIVIKKGTIGGYRIVAAGGKRSSAAVRIK